MTIRSLLAAVALFAASSVALLACGGSSDKKTASGAATTDSATPAAASSADFPSPNGRSLRQVVSGMSPGPLFATTSQDFTAGTNRFGFELFSPSRKVISGIPAALYVQRSGDTHVLGPYAAQEGSYSIKPQFESATVKGDGDAVKSVYLTNIKLPTPGVYAVLAVAKLDGRLVATQPAGVRAVAHDPVPAVGQLAPKIDTPTVASVHGNLDSIDTRQPHDSMHQVNFADVYKKKPIVLLFSTPALCQSRTCGPMTDIAEQVKSQMGSKATFIHMEVYLDNTIKPGCLEGTRPESQCFRPQFLAYHLPSEPWVFGIDRHGRIAARIEGPFAKSELENLVRAAAQH